MIFVSMDAGGLVRRTSQYHLRSTSLPNHATDSEISPPTRSHPDYRPVSRRRDSASREVPPPLSDGLPRAAARPTSWGMGRYYADSDITFRDLNHPALQSPPMNALSAASHPNLARVDQEFNVTTHCDQPSDDEEEESSPQTLADRYQREFSARERRQSSFSPTSDEDADEAINRAVTARRLGMSPSRIRSLGPARRRHSPSRIEVAQEGDEESDGSTVLAPHAKFFIESEKSTVSVSFDPPV